MSSGCCSGTGGIWPGQGALIASTSIRPSRAKSRSMAMKGSMSLRRCWQASASNQDSGCARSDTMQYIVVLSYDDETGGWGASLPDVPGCVAVGRSREEVTTGIREALQWHLETMIEDG